MILTHGANSLERGGGGDFVEIGGRMYPTVQMPDGNIWLAQNLDYVWQGLTVNGYLNYTIQQAAYYNKDEQTYGWTGQKRGLLYNYRAADYLETNKATLIPGWHVASTTEWNNLITALGENPGTKLKALDNSIESGFPSGWNGTDNYGFSALPTGRNSGDDFIYPDECWFITLPAPVYSSTTFEILRPSASDVSQTIEGTTTMCGAIRLVKDAT
jgi:uncharacterized protein (TIGR02145 family)